jgi:hypothetical protein
MKIYQRMTGEWVLQFTSPEDFREFDTELEAQVAMDKTTYVEKGRDLASQMGQLATDLKEYEDIWNDRLYGAGLTNAITEEDTASAGITVSQLTSFINFTAQLRCLLDNQPLFQGDYWVSINQMRGDL